MDALSLLVGRGVLSKKEEMDILSPQDLDGKKGQKNLGKKIKIAVVGLVVCLGHCENLPGPEFIHKS